MRAHSPSDGLEPSTASLPWRYSVRTQECDLLGRHQDEQSRRARRSSNVRPQPDVRAVVAVALADVE